MIIFVGDKPSKKNIDPNIPFVGTQSYKRLLEWIWQMDIDISQVTITNIDNFWHRLPYGYRFETGIFVALGKNASKFLSNQKNILQQNLDYYELPHPSGLNRKLNDKKWLNKELKKCKEWLNE